MPRIKLAVTAAALSGLALAGAPAADAQARPAVPSGPDRIAVPAPTPPPPVAPPVVPGPAAVTGTVPVSLAKMVNGISSRLTGAVGYQYTIVKDGQVAAEDGVGDARRAADGQRDMLSTDRIEVMSVTKNMTAIALLGLLDQRGISVDAPIGRYLPLSWAKAGGFRRFGSKRITFRHLLTHTSGINQAMTAAPASAELGNGWEGLRKLVAYGATPNSAPNNYKNANFALMRVLIPRLDGMVVPTEQTAYVRYLQVLNRDVFAPAGVPQITCFAADDAAAALVYDATVPNGGGLLPERQGDDAADCGGHTGLHLSSRDLAKVVAHLRHTEKLLPADVRQAMFDGRLGWNEGSDNGNGRTDTKGIWWHGGDGTWSGREMHSCVMALPQGLSATLIVNSQPSSACGVLLNAYKDSVK